MGSGSACTERTVTLRSCLSGSLDWPHRIPAHNRTVCYTCCVSMETIPTFHSNRNGTLVNMLCFTLRKIVPILAVAVALGAPAFAANDSYTYLALGDSIPFGLNPLILPPYVPISQLPRPDQFVGYPEIVARVEHVAELNTSCPGETSGSFLDASSLDNGCNSPHFLPPPAPPIPPFKTTIGLHAAYTGAQMKFAEDQLKSNKRINLVTLSIGANDVLLILPQLQQCGADQGCANSVLGPVLQAYAESTSP